MKIYDLAILASALYAGVGDIGGCYSSNSSRKQPQMPPSKPKQLREYTWKGHTVMAYSKDDARNRIKAQLAKGE